MNTITTCLNGELKPGDLVLSSPKDDYPCLVGTVISIGKINHSEKEYVFVNFMHPEYSENRLQEIEKMLGDAYGRPTTPGIWPLDIDNLPMSPESLIRITGIREDLLKAVLDSEKAAEALYEIVEIGPGIAQAKSTVEQLYSPLNFYLRDEEDAQNGQYDEADYWRDTLSHEDAFGYMRQIQAYLDRDRQSYATERGLAEYLRSESLSGKVQSLIPAIELHGDKLWVVAHLRLNEPLTQPEMAELKDWWEGQLSDGVGESWEQHEIKVDRGELYLEPWTSADGFFIDTQQEFFRRLGLETPAQAALHEPDIYDSPEAAALRNQLIAKIDENLLSYFDELHTNKALSITGMSSEIAAVTGAHYYLSEIHNFHTSELRYLLQFKNPLQVVGDAFQISGMDDYSDVMWDIFDRQDAMQGDYALMPEAADGDALRQALFEKLDANWEENMAAYRGAVAVPGLSVEELLSLAQRVSAVDAAHTFLKWGYEFGDGELARLAALTHPLDAVADGWRDISGYMNPEEGMRDFLSGIENVRDEPLIPHPAEKPEKSEPAAEKRSVLEQLREAAKTPKEPHKDNPTREKSGPER